MLVNSTPRAPPPPTPQLAILVRSRDENDWRHGEVIRQLAAMAALFHDFGKANAAFQKKLADSRKGKKAIREAYRHEWVSLRLFVALVGDAKDDLEWIQRLANKQSDLSDWQGRLSRDGIDDFSPSAPLQNLPTLARALGWLIVCHHRLPVPDNYSALRSVGEGHLKKIENYITATWCDADINAENADKKKCWSFDHGLPLDSDHWRKHAARVATALLHLDGSIVKDWLDHPQVMHFG